MGECRFAPTSKFGRYAAQFFYPSVGIICIAAGIWALIDSVKIDQFGSPTIFCLAMASGISFLMFAMSFWCYTFESRRFAVSENGITVSDNGQTSYRWEEVHGIVISVFGASASKESYQSVICVFLKPNMETILQKIIHGYLYGARHKDAVVIIDYCPDMVEKIASVYPGTILDRRKEQLGLFVRK